MAEPHDTDPLADTQHSTDDAAPGTKKSRVVHVGDVVGRYELVEEVGEGGMATVYRARDRELRRDVAVKVLFPHLARRPDIVRRFHREARAAAALDHANILRVYDVGGGDEADGGLVDPPYIVMELVRGRSLLGEIEQRGPLLAELAACVGALLADALAAAHAAGVVHRDVKPANVMLAPPGRVLLADFGVARLETEDSSLVTKTGALLGTPAYMSPEQASGDTATAKSDLYSLGATLYQLATGALPYAGPPAKVLAQIAVGSFVPPVKKHANVGPELSRAIESMMAVDPSARPANAAAVGAELRAIAAAGGLRDAAAELAAYFADRDKFLVERTPGVVTGILEAASRAATAGKLPRAIALADRAAALAPDDPRVKTLVEEVARGGRTTRRRKVVAIGAAAVAVLGGAGYGVMRLVGGGAAAAGVDAPAVIVARAPADAPAVQLPSVDATGEPAAPPVDAAVAIAPRPRVDAGLAHHARDAAEPAVAIADAALPVATPPAVDAGPVAPPPPKIGWIVVRSDRWCDVTVDGGESKGRNGGPPIEVTPGHHVVLCKQTGLDTGFRQEVDVVAGQTARVDGKVVRLKP